jgi:alanine racemase
MHTKYYNSYLLVDLDRMRQNVDYLLGELPRGVQLVPVLKDDAYGLGLLPVAKTLLEFPAIRTLAVAHVSEGVALRRAGVDQKTEILVMGGIPNRLLRPAVDYELTAAVGRLGLAHDLAHLAAKLGTTARIQVKIETGLHRTGLLPGEELSLFLQEFSRCQRLLRITGAFTHFAYLSDKKRTQKQFEDYLAGTVQLEEGGLTLPMCHIAASAATELYPQYHLNAVRIGRRLNWDHPTQPTGKIQETATWRTYITNIRHLDKGELVGYNGACRLERDTAVATIGVGYGDGLSQEIVQKHGPVLVCGQRVPLLACCMDQAMIDVTGLPCHVDDEVTLFGWDRHGHFLSSQEVSLLAGDSEGCGLTSALSPRVARVYVKTDPATEN